MSKAVAFVSTEEIEEIYIKNGEDVSEPLSVDVVSLHGGLHPTAFKTYRNAARAANAYEDVDPGVVLLLDLTRLPVVDPDESSAALDNADDDLAFAERQMLMWGQRCERLARERRP